MQAQNVSELIFGSNSRTEYIGQHTDGRNLRNGIGVLRLKGGAVYAGDFAEGKMSGKGMIISPNTPIANAPGATFFVGGFLNGKKERKGISYSSKGEVLYQGAFVSDKPAEKYPMSNPPSTQNFVIHDYGDQLFLGEVSNGIPNGFGLLVLPDGSIWIGTFKNGERNGVCITLFGGDTWEAGKWSDGKYIALNNSAIQANRREEYIAARQQLRVKFLSEFAELSNNITNDIIALNDIHQRSKGGYTSASNSTGHLPSVDNSSTVSASYSGGQSTTATSGSHLEEVWEKCTDCGGDGICDYCNGTGLGPKTITGTSVKEKCRFCHGNKYCDKCQNGKRKRTIRVANDAPSPSTTNPKRESYEVMVNCGQCYATGRCQKCAGSSQKGWIESGGQLVRCWYCKNEEPGNCHICHGKKQVPATAYQDK